VPSTSAPPLIKTATLLADGRELIYFDERERSRDEVDLRRLPELQTEIELRRDPLLDAQVVIASQRQDRLYLPPEDECPLCPSAPGRSTEIPAYDYDVVVFENRFPSFATATEQLPVLPGGDTIAVRSPARGRCEVVCFTQDHDSSFAELPLERVRTVVEVWIDRTVALSRLEGVEQVFSFENRGEEIGVTLHHPHGQIYAYPFVTPRTRRMLESALRHQAATGRNLFADVLAGERRARTRIVAEGGLWTAFVPAFARWPFEIHLYPNRQLPDLQALSDDERDEFARLYGDVLRGLDRLFELPMPYVSAVHQAPVRSGRELFYLHLQVFSSRRSPEKLKFLAASESAMSVFINDVRPEEAAEMLRDAVESGRRARTQDSRRAPSEARQT
jgi:UDPglucose--hexose-1-phosphate uridylyltransferase